MDYRIPMTIYVFFQVLLNGILSAVTGSLISEIRRKNYKMSEIHDKYFKKLLVQTCLILLYHGGLFIDISV